MAQNEQAKKIVNSLEDIYKKLPALPANVNEFLVMIAPWIALIFGILGIISSIGALGIFSFLSPFMVMGSGVSNTGFAFLEAGLWLIASVLLLLAFPGLKDRKEKGWMFYFWSETVSLVAAVIAVSVGGILGVLISWYLLFQIKKYYK